MAQTTFNYDYQAQGGQPPNGKCYQSSGALALVSVSNTDNDGNDNTAFLTGVTVNDQISCNGVVWTVTEILIKGSNVQFTVDPPSAAPPYGVTAISFGQSKTAETSVVIAAGESLSTSVDLTDQAAVMVITPPDWSPANVTFQVSMDNVTFYDFYDNQGNEILRAIRPGAAMLIDPAMTEYVNYLKIRSGPKTNPVPQQDDRIVQFITQAVG
jgi:hypothetical protein